MAIVLSTATKNSLLTRLAQDVDAAASPGKIEVWSGTRPTPEGTPAGTLLGTFTLESPAFSSVVDGVATLDADPTLSTAASASGTASWARMTDGDNNVLFTGTVGTASSSDFVINATNITSGQTLNIISGIMQF